MFWRDLKNGNSLVHFKFNYSLTTVYTTISGCQEKGANLVFNFLATYEDGSTQPITVALIHESESERDAWIKAVRYASEQKPNLKKIEWC